MNVKRIEAVLNSRYAMQELECLQLGNLYVCADKTSEIGHLVYRQEDWCGELRHNGFKVRELEIAVDIDGSTFNELDLKHYEIDGCDIYLFPGIAVKTGDTLEILCQKDVTIHDAVQKWEIQAEPEDFIPTVEYSIPQDERGSLAVEIENLNFGIWDSFFRCPGETVDDEERLENIAVYYRELSDGKSAGELIGCAIQGLQEMLEEIRRISQLEGLTQPLEDYRQWLSDLQKIPAKEAEKARLLDTMQKLREESVLVWEQQKQEIQQKQEAKKAEIEAVQKTIWNHQENGKRFQNMQVDFNEQLVQKENEFRQQDREKYEPEFQEYLEGRQSRNYEYLMRERIKKKQPLEDAQEKAYEKLVEARSAYLRKYPNRTYSATIRDNDVYEKQLSNLECDNLEKYREEAQEQARAAVEHFKVDFVSKIRYAIKEAYQKKDELNRIISRLDFGKDKYQFVITKNKGPDGRFYRMFMDDALDINPSQLSDHMENQMNLFTMEHEEEYGDLMNELIEIFIPPENATREELEEARKNMDKYADYRTYLSFDMQQIVQGEKDMRIGLSKMIKKNSGGEGQNPLYIALLASFAQIYRINLSPKIKRPPTLRLVVLDEAFSKMDAEKVASCISLIRGLGFQAIISATNDKIQNYLENVDKTFVYANPNKRHISIQEFERMEFEQLQGEE